MAIITVRNIPDLTKEALRVKAALEGVSLEQYVRMVLEKASQDEPQETRNIMEIASSYFVHSDAQQMPGREIELPSRQSNRDVPDFKE